MRPLALALLCGLTALAVAQEFPAPTGFVVDEADLISAEQEAQITSLCERMREAGAAEIAVVTVGSTGALHSKDYAVELFNRWGIGETGKDNGFLILISLSSPMGGRRDRRIEFEVGYGLEGVLPDAICKRIQTEEMIPLMKSGRVSEGIYRGVYKAAERIDAAALEGQAEPVAAVGSGTSDWPGFLVCSPPCAIALLFLLIVAAARLASRMKCARCGAWCRKVSDRLVARATALQAGIREQHFVCPRCGWSKTRRKRFRLSEGYTATGMYIGSSGGSSGGGSSFGGFSGGSSGGGGAGSSW